MKLRTLTELEKSILKEFFVEDYKGFDLIDSMAFANEIVEDGVWLCYDVSESKKYCIAIKIYEKDGFVNKILDEFMIDIKSSSVDLAHNIDILDFKNTKL